MKSIKLSLSQIEKADVEDNYNFDESAEKVANERDQIVVYPKDNQLQIDIDNNEDFEVFENNMGALDLDCHIAIKPSKSGLPNRHITLTFDDRTFSEYERIALQFALGSDPMRECLNIMRLEHGVEQPTRLFENNPRNHE
mgnify:CR=1 FL=1